MKNWNTKDKLMAATVSALFAVAVALAANVWARDIKGDAYTAGMLDGIKVREVFEKSGIDAAEKEAVRLAGQFLQGEK